ncbi:MAG TPA: DUF3488 and transglutaminase-like domain-containing protein [Candidatus Sulfotelmatobacter sp.]
MPSVNSHPDASSLTRTINHYFDLSLYLLVLAGFVTLASSGGLDLPAGIIVGVAFAFRGALLARRHKFVISERWATPLTLGYFAFFAADYFIFSRSFLNSTIHLVLFAIIIRMFSLRRDRDHLMLAILAFLTVLASAVLTVDSAFLFCFAGFLLVAMSTFVLMEMRRSLRRATIEARHASDAGDDHRFALSLMRLAPSLMLTILVGSAGLFFLMPRMSAGYMGSYSFGNDFSTGFADQVRLGRIGEIQQSNALVMHIQIDGDKDGHHDLHWRGIALSFFDGRSWLNARRPLILEKQEGDNFDIPSFGTLGNGSGSNSSGQHAETSHESLIHYRVLMEPIGTNVFFLAPWARRITGHYSVLSADSGAAVHDLDNEHPITSYEAESDIGVPSPDRLRLSTGSYPAQVVPENLQLPPLDRRIPSLAAKISSSAANDFDRAVAVETYLKNHYGYTLQLPRVFPADPLADFLFQRRQGHCEYFASSMAVMLRTLGIPARVVNGFRSDEFNDLTGNYVVRAKNAHAWVEAYFPGYGWQTFDPTPAVGSDAPRAWGRLALYVDAASSFWRDWVVSYDSSHQYALSQRAVNATNGLWLRLRFSARQRYLGMLRWAQRHEGHFEQPSTRWIGFLAMVGILGLVLRYAPHISSWIWEKWLNANASRLPEPAAAMWYERMLRLLARRGMPKPAAQTPYEFVEKIDDELLRRKVGEFTGAYESARFGNCAEDAQRLRELYHQVETVQLKHQ